MQRRNKGALRRCFCACSLSLLLCAACSGCALLDTLARWVESGVSGEPYVSREEQIYIETAESFLDAVAREDRAAVRALFSENVRETDEDLTRSSTCFSRRISTRRRSGTGTTFSCRAATGTTTAGTPPSCRTPSRYAIGAGTTGAASS